MTLLTPDRKKAFVDYFCKSRYGTGISINDGENIDLIGDGEYVFYFGDAFPDEMVHVTIREGKTVSLFSTGSHKLTVEQMKDHQRSLSGGGTHLNQFGEMYEKYPSEITQAAARDWICLYLGNKDVATVETEDLEVVADVLSIAEEYPLATGIGALLYGFGNIWEEQHYSAIRFLLTGIQKGNPPWGKNQVA